MRKKLLALFLCVTCVLSTAACGKKNKDSSQTEQTTTQTSNSQSSKQEATSTKSSSQGEQKNESSSTSEEPLELTMYFPVSVGGGPDALIDALCQQYHEENPNITVNPVYAGSYARWI